MRNSGYKLLHFDDGHQEFYNLTDDPGESNDLLDGTLTATEQSNYVYLCNEMTTLVGSSSFCDASVDTDDVDEGENVPLAYPNPFTSYVYLASKSGNEQFKLVNPFGHVIYSGNDMENQDFSNLASGMYFLKISDTKIYTFKIYKL